jgi:hypothetical protein
MNLNEEKFILGAVSTGFVVGCWAATCKFPALAPTLSTVVGGITMLYGIFCGANVSSRWVDGKSDQPAQLGEEDISQSPFVEPHVDSNCKK